MKDRGFAPIRFVQRTSAYRFVRRNQKYAIPFWMGSILVCILISVFAEVLSIENASKIASASNGIALLLSSTWFSVAGAYFFFGYPRLVWSAWKGRRQDKPSWILLSLGVVVWIQGVLFLGVAGIFIRTGLRLLAE